MQSALRWVVLGVLLVVIPRTAFADAKSLLRERSTLVVKMQINAPDTNYNPRVDDNDSSVVTSSGTSRTDGIAGPVITTTTSGSRQGGGMSPSARMRIDRATAANAEYQARIDAIDRELATMDPAVVAAARAEVEREERNFNPAAAVFAVPAFFLSLPGTGMTSMGAHIYSGPDNSGFGGFTVQASMSNVIGVANAGGMIAMNIELGGYKDSGTCGWIGLDIGFGLRGKTSYLGVGWGIHYGGLVGSRKYAPAVALFGFKAGKVGIAGRFGAGWRYIGGNSQTEPDDPPVDDTYDLPLGFEAYHAELLVNISSLQLGVSYQDMDGVKSGGMLVGVGAIAFAGRR